MNWPTVFNAHGTEVESEVAIFVRLHSKFKKLSLNFSSDLDLALAGVEVRSYPLWAVAVVFQYRSTDDYIGAFFGGGG